MKETIGMTQDGEFRVDIEEDTETLFRNQTFDTLPGTVVLGTGIGHNLSVARLEAEQSFTKAAELAFDFYRKDIQTA